MQDIKVPSGTNPQKAIETKHGTYKDPVETLSESDRFPNTTEGPQPSPFKSLRDA